MRARHGVLLCGLAAIPPEKVLLAAAAVEYHTEEVIGRGPVRAERLDDRVAPGGDVGVEVLIDERAGGKAPLTRPKARVISRSDAAYWRAMSLTRRARPFTGSTRHAHMALRSSAICKRLQIAGQSTNLNLNHQK